jgi:hypothetical protein
MATPEKRRFIRQESLHLLDYLVVDQDGVQSTYSMGRTRDVSIDGMKLETTESFTFGTHLLITLGLEDNLVDIQGEVTHCQPKGGRYLSGITFLKINKSDRKILVEYVEAFRQRQKEERGKNAPPK